MASSMWTPSLFHKIFAAIARSDAGVLGAMDGRSHTIALNEFVRFMKANNYQKLGLMLTDLTDAFKFANQATDDGDRNEMTEAEFAQCVLFVQARYAARKANDASALTSINRPPFELSSNVAAQLGPFLVELCGSKLIVQGGATGKQITEVFLRTPLPSRPSSAGDDELGEDAQDGLPSRHLPDDDEEANAKPITQREMNAFIQEMRQIFTRLSKRAKANRYLERIIAASKGGLNPMPSKSEQDERSRLTLEFRTAIQDMGEMNELVRTLDSSILVVDKQLKALLEQRSSGLAVEEEGKDGGPKKMWISAEEENKLKQYERKLNDRVNEFEKRIGMAIASNMKERHDIQEHRSQIMELKREIAALDQVALGIEFMTSQHGLLTGHVLEEQQELKGRQFDAIKRLKELQLDTAAECRKLEAQCAQMDARMQAVENELLEKPPDRAAMNEIAVKKAAAKLELKETKAKAEALEAKMKMMLVKMGIAPTYELREMDNGQSFHYINNDSFLEIFQTFEDKAFKGETEITAWKMKIAKLEAEISALNEEYNSHTQEAASASARQKELIDSKSKQLDAAQAAVSVEDARLQQTEGLLVEMERLLASINDQLAKLQASSGSKAKPQPVREVFVPPVPDAAPVRTRKLLEARLLKLLGSRTTVLATDLLCSAGAIDLVCHDRRDRVVLVCFANPLTDYTVDTALVSHCSEIQSAFYMLRRLPAGGIDALKNCFLGAAADSCRDILNARVHRFIIVGRTISDDCDTSSFASSVELIKAGDISEVWHGEATKRALLGGVPSPEELLELISADAACENDVPAGLTGASRAIFQSKKAWSMLRESQRLGKLANKVSAAAASKVSYTQFVNWLRKSAHAAQFSLPPDASVDEVMKQFILTDMKWGCEAPDDQDKRMRGSLGPHAIYRYVAQMGEHIKLFSACGVTFTELSPSPPPPEADSGLEAIVEAWKTAAAVQEAEGGTEPAAAGETETPSVPGKHEVAGGTWMVEAIARLVLRHIGCLPPMKEEEQAADCAALKSSLKKSQANEDADASRRDLRYQPKCSKKFPGLSHAQEFLLFGHKMVESQQNLKECEDLLEQFLDHYAGVIAAHNKGVESRAEGGCSQDGVVFEHRRQRNKVIVRPPSLSSSDEDEAVAQHRKRFEELFIKSKPATQDEQADLIDACALRGEFKAAPVTQAGDNVLRIDPAVKAAAKEKRFHSRVYVGTVHASLKFLPNRNWYPELHSEMRRSLQKFETLTKSLSKIKGAPKVVNLAEEHDAKPKETKLPKVQAASRSPHDFPGSASDLCDPELFGQLTLLDRLLRLPAEQLRASSTHATSVPRADFGQPAAQLPHDASAGVTLFSSAAALGGNSAAPQRDASAASPSRSVKFAAADADLVKVRHLPAREEAFAAAFGSKPPPAKVSPRTRAIKMSASAARNPVGATERDPSSAVVSTRDVVAPDAKAAYGSVRFGAKATLAAQLPRPADNRRRSSAALAAEGRGRT